nr:hypothetical protein [Tanacetum cinerariifolium]
LYDTEDEVETEVVYLDRGELLVTRRLLNTAILDQDDDTTWLRSNIFHTQCTAKERPVSKEEVKRAIWDCGIDKSPGPDGFTFGFYRRYWDTIEKEVVEAVSYFLKEGNFLKGGNASFIALIPKKQDVKGQIRMWVNHTKETVGLKKSKLKGMLNEIDVLINDKKVDQELLNKKVKVSNSLQELEKLEAIDIAQKVKIKWSIEGDESSKFFHALDCFYKASGLRLNFHKSKILGIAVEDDLVSQATIKLGCEILKEKKMAWFKWSRVLASKEKGGLGVASLFALNRALLFKWIWRFHNDKNSLWARFVGALFWEDVWMGYSNFKSCFPRLYALETDKKISVVDKLNQNEVGSTLRRLPRNGVEMDQYTALAEILEVVILPDMSDRWIWALTGSGDFSVSSSRKFIDEQSIIGLACLVEGGESEFEIEMDAERDLLRCLVAYMELSE